MGLLFIYQRLREELCLLCEFVLDSRAFLCDLAFGFLLSSLDPCVRLRLYGGGVAVAFTCGDHEGVEPDFIVVSGFFLRGSCSPFFGIQLCEFLGLGVCQGGLEPHCCSVFVLQRPDLIRRWYVCWFHRGGATFEDLAVG